MEKKQTKKHNFGELEVEKAKINNEWVELQVWQSPKYQESKQKAIEMIDSEKYGLSDGDFWILKNKTTTGKIAYTGLIISHNGCLKINDNMDNKVKPECFSLDKEGYNNSLVYIYVDDDTYEVGEFSPTNGKNDYPYAMAFKRCFDRVVLKKSKLAYSGIYSEVEASEFSKDIVSEDLGDKANLLIKLQELAVEADLDYKKIIEKFGVQHDIDMTVEDINKAISILEKGQNKNAE